jgi:hypothetical protein
MIVDAIAGGLLAAMTWLVSLLPTGTLELEGFSGIWLGYAQFNGWLPLTELLACAALMISLQLILYGYLAFKAVRSWLPFI